ncbi:MAG: hypothetical protein RXR30_00115 [Nitrososphaeria archaeon]
MFIKNYVSKKADFYVKKVDKAFLTLSKITGIKIILAEEIEKNLEIKGINVYHYKYDPSKDFKGPLVTANVKNYKAVLEYIRKHPNRVFAVIVDFNNFITNNESHLDFIKSLRKIYPIPLLYGSGATNVHEFVSPIVLNYAVEFFYGIKNFENKKLYRSFFEKLASLLGDERYFEKI